jgi:hypothetical protein
VPRLNSLVLILLLLVGGVAGISVAPSTAHAGDRVGDRVIQVPLTIHVATKDGRSVVSEGDVLAAVRRANRELAAFDLHLVVHEIVPMLGGAEIETQRQRFELARRAARDGTVHVFFVDRLKLSNPRKGDRRVSGMHWRYHGFDADIRAREYVAVAHNAPTTTLVHEIGHAFGLAHDKRSENLMCSCRRDLDPAFTKHQGRRLRTGAKRFLRRAP